MRHEDFSAFYAACRPRLLRVLLVAALDAQDGEDSLQEAFLRAAQRWPKVSRLDDPEAWVRRVAINLLRDGHRRRLRGERARRLVGAPPDAAAPVTDTVGVVAALRALPLVQRQALALHYLADRSVEEVARELGRPVGTVKAQLSRGRARLAELMSTEDVG